MQAVLNEIWKYPLHHSASVFATNGDDCYFGARNTRLVAAKVTTGEVQWTVPILNPHGWLAVNTHGVFYLNQHSHLIAPERKSGALRWSRDLRGINGWLHASATRVVVGGWRGYTDIVALDESDGSLVWSIGARNVALHSSRIHAESDTLMVVDTQEGQVKIAPQIAERNGVAAFGTDSGEVVALNVGRDG